MMEGKIIQIKKRFEVLNVVNTEAADMYIYGTIGPGWFSDISANDVRYRLQSIQAKTINLHIHSGGGDVFESIAIYNLLKNSDKTVNIYIDGLAGSGASIVAMAGDAIFMPRNTMMMIHNAWTFAQGNAAQLRKLADDLDKIDGAVKESYRARFKGEDFELERMLDDETWLKADECVAFGLADQVIDAVELPDDENDKGDDTGEGGEPEQVPPAAASINRFAAMAKAFSFATQNIKEKSDK